MFELFAVLVMREGQAFDSDVFPVPRLFLPGRDGVAPVILKQRLDRTDIDPLVKNLLGGNHKDNIMGANISGTNSADPGDGSGVINLVGNPNYPFSTTVVETDPSNNFAYDDQLSLYSGPAQYLTVDGLYFTYGSLDLNLYQTGSGPGYDGWFEGNGNGDTNGTFTITSYDISQNDTPPVPEPGSFLLLGTGLFALAGRLLRRGAPSPQG